MPLPPSAGQCSLMHLVHLFKRSDCFVFLRTTGGSVAFESLSGKASDGQTVVKTESSEICHNEMNDWEN